MELEYTRNLLKVLKLVGNQSIRIDYSFVYYSNQVSFCKKIFVDLVLIFCNAGFIPRYKLESLTKS